MRIISIFTALLLFSCGEQGRVENNLEIIEHNSDIEKEENASSMMDTESIQGVTTWNTGIEERNLWNSLRGIFYHEKLDPIYARKATEDLNNFIEFEGKRIFKCFADIDFSGIRILSDSIKIDYRQYSEWNSILFSSAVLENREVTFDNSNSKFIITESYSNNSIITYELIVDDVDNFLLRIRLDGKIQALTGFVSSPEIDLNGFHRFYRWSGPTEIYKEWPDGSFDPKKSANEYFESREDL